MKITITTLKPVTQDLLLIKGTVYKNTETIFNDLILELGKNTIIGQDTSDWPWKDFFHHTQYPNGVNGSPVEQITVLNVNDTRLSLELKYERGALVIVILKMPSKYDY